MFKWYLFQLLTTGLKLVLPLTMSADHNLSEMFRSVLRDSCFTPLPMISAVQKLRPRDLGSKTERSHRADGFAETARETAPPQWSPSWPAACFQTCLSPFLALGELDGGVGTSWMWKMRWGGDELTARPNTCCVDSCVQSYLSPILFWLGNPALSVLLDPGEHTVHLLLCPQYYNLDYLYDWLSLSPVCLVGFDYCPHILTLALIIIWNILSLYLV